jgi:hypothetical protein
VGTDHSKPRTQLREYLALLSQRDATGLPFIIVGGQAANFWAALYLPREPRLQQHLPLTSKDLDLIGTEPEAAKVAAAINWHMTPPPVGGGPVQAVLSSEPEGRGLTVEFLSEIKGVSHETIVEYARENRLHSPDGAESLPVRVLDPVILLAGKVRNAVDIEQDLPEKPRQDVKHIAMLALCVPHFLEEVRLQVPHVLQRKETLGNYIRTLAALQHTYSARQFETRHPGVIHWQELIPKTIRQMTFDRQVKSLLRQISGEGQSRGISI